MVDNDMADVVVGSLSSPRKRQHDDESRSELKRRKLASPTSSSDNDEIEASFVDDLMSESKGTASTPLTPASPWRKYPSEEKTHQCTFEGCSKSFNRPARLAEHLRSHTNERPFQCSYEGCGKAFLRDTHLTHHVKSAHTSIREYTCDWSGCGKAFLTATRLRRHRDVHEGEHKYRCTEFPPCHEVFRKHQTLQRHIVSVHYGRKPFPCTEKDSVSGQPCTQAFETSGKLRAHIGRLHSGLRFWCQVCRPTTLDPVASEDDSMSVQSHGVGFPTYTLLQAHLREIHPPSCAECPKICVSERELRRHIQQQHQSPTEERPFACSHAGCGQSFSKKRSLTLHERAVHDRGGRHKFVCSSSGSADGQWEACGRSLKNQASLDDHVQRTHLSTPAKAAHKDIIGSLTGTGYATDPARSLECLCPPCSYRFKRSYDLTLHLQSAHGISLDEVHDLIVEQDMLKGGKFWLNGMDPDLPMGDDDDHWPEEMSDYRTGKTQSGDDVNNDEMMIDPMLQ